jgi:hypothetical protein
MSRQKTRPRIVLMLGMALSIAGATLVVAYILEAVVARWGEPDQSLVFWYLPILFSGGLAFTAGMLASVWGFKRLRWIHRMNRIDPERTTRTETGDSKNVVR